MFVSAWAGLGHADNDHSSTLKHLEILTGGALASEPLPLVIALHGYGDTPENFSDLWRHYPKAARIVLLQAPKTKGRGFSWFTIVRPIDFSHHPVSHEIMNVSVDIVRTVRHLMATRPTIGRPIVTGFSQGGILSLTLALHYPDVFAAAVPIAGTVPIRFRAVDTQPAPVYAFHGTADRVVTLASLQRSQVAFSEGGRPIQLKTYRDVQHWMTPDMRRDVYTRVGALIDNEMSTEQ
ncbi:MAG: dienelactone hydrolase family protein [Myxococcota bacterium]|nr:dienelactone hydrolase family protein [Myxococcota bacterium]